MDEIEIKTMQDIKDYVKSLDTPDNEVYQKNSLLIMSCFSKAIEFIEENSKLRQFGVSGSFCEKCNPNGIEDGNVIRCKKCGRGLALIEQNYH